MWSLTLPTFQGPPAGPGRVKDSDALSVQERMAINELLQPTRTAPGGMKADVCSLDGVAFGGTARLLRSQHERGKLRRGRATYEDNVAEATRWGFHLDIMKFAEDDPEAYAGLWRGPEAYAGLWRGPGASVASVCRSLGIEYVLCLTLSE